MKIGPIILGIGIVALAGYILSSREDDSTPAPEVQRDHINPKKSSDLEAYLREGFGTPGYEADWYKSITSVRVEGSTAIAEVSTSDGAPGVCRGVSSYVYDQTRTHELDSVRVQGSNGLLLIDRPTIRDPCRVKR